MRCLYDSVRQGRRLTIFLVGVQKKARAEPGWHLHQVDKKKAIENLDVVSASVLGITTRC